MTVKCRKKFQSMGWPWLSLREMQLMSEVSDIFSSLDLEKIQFIFVCFFVTVPWICLSVLENIAFLNIQLIFVCLFLRHCPLSTYLSALWEHPCEWCGDPAQQVDGREATIKRLHIYLKNGKELPRRRTRFKGEKIWVVGNSCPFS